MHRFDRIAAGTGVGRDVLPSWLKSLVESGVLAKEQYRRTHRATSTYPPRRAAHRSPYSAASWTGRPLCDQRRAPDGVGARLRHRAPATHGLRPPRRNPPAPAAPGCRPHRRGGTAGGRLTARQRRPSHPDGPQPHPAFHVGFSERRTHHRQKSPAR
ncbi:hypothetical protein ACFVTP_02155 [Streptomyces celluloflavus]|uniref:hypothetical protein n=1 Tax=Streptomyces celluloflavus TaxID=58344 RepID=UPI0036DC5DE8